MWRSFNESEELFFHYTLKNKFPWRICNILTFNIHGVYKQPFVEWNGSNTMLKVLDATINAIKETLFIQVCHFRCELTAEDATE